MKGLTEVLLAPLCLYLFVALLVTIVLHLQVSIVTNDGKRPCVPLSRQALLIIRRRRRRPQRQPFSCSTFLLFSVHSQ